MKVLNSIVHMILWNNNLFTLDSMPCNAYRSLLQNWISFVILILPLVYYHRFEPDMLAFSGCYYGGGEKERRELGAIRRRWKTLHVRVFV